MPSIFDRFFKKATPASTVTEPPIQPVTPQPTAPIPPSKPSSPTQLRISDAGVDFIKSFEGLVLSAYPDPASELGKKARSMRLKLESYTSVPNWKTLSGSPWTIGYGHTGPEVVAGLTVSEEKAEEILREDIERFEKGVLKLVKVPLTQGQFDALVSFSFNVGLGNLETSTLLRLLNANKAEEAAEQFARWDKAQGKVEPGLTRRRAAEKNIFLR
jgi:lysozyme